MNTPFVTIRDDYIAYLQSAEPHIMSNKADSRTYRRKYIGIIEELNGHHYFVPLSSPKPRDYTADGKIKKDSLTTIYVKDEKNLFATLRFNCMIPVPASEIEAYNLNDEGDLKYKLIVYNELYFIRRNGEKITRTARNLYAAKQQQAQAPKSKQALLAVTLDFAQLEKLCDDFTP